MLDSSRRRHHDLGLVHEPIEGNDSSVFDLRIVIVHR